MRNEPCWCGSGKKQKKCHKDVAGNSAFASLETFYNKVDDKVSNEVGNLPCRKGCSQCCYDHFFVSSVEWYYIISNLQDRYGVSKVNEVIDKGYKMWKEFEEERPDLAEKFKVNVTSKNTTNDKHIMQKFELMLGTMYDSNETLIKQPCIFLDTETHACSIYDLRPIICRQFGVSYTKEEKEVSVHACEMITNEYEKYMNEMVDFTEQSEEAKGFQSVFLSRFDAFVQDRTYPFFYLCKIQKENPGYMNAKIDEFKKLSLEDVFTRKIERANR